MAPPVVTKDSIHIIRQTIVKDSLIYLPGDSIGFNNYIGCPEISYTGGASSHQISATATLHNGYLSVNCKYDSLVARIHWLENNQQVYARTHSIKTITQPVIIYKEHAWLWWYAGIVTLILGIANIVPLFVPNGSLLSSFLKKFRRG